MKIKNKSFFFSFLILFSLISITFGNATIISKPTFTANHLDVVVGDFQGINTWGLSKQIHCYVGGEDLLEFNNIGQIDYDLDTNQILYKAQVRVGFESYIYTTVTQTDVDPNFKPNKYIKQIYLSVDKFPRRVLGPHYWSHYTVNYYTIDFDIVNTHKYTGYFPIEIGVKNTKGFGGELKLGDYTFQMPALVYDVMDIQIKEHDKDYIGIYDDVYINYNPTNEGKLSIVSVTETTANQKVMDYINERADIGWEYLGQIKGPFTLQNFQSDGYLLKINNQQYKLQIVLRPEITETHQVDKLTSAVIWWDYEDTWLSPAGMGFLMGPTTDYVDRPISVKVNNRMMYFKFEVFMDLYMTVEPDYVLSESELHTPFFTQGDWVWDTTYQGDVPTLPEETYKITFFGKLFSWLITLIIIGIGLYVFIVVVIPYLRRKAKGRK